MTSAAPPPEVALAAAKVQSWLDEQATARLSAEEIAKLTPAEKLNYARRFDQAQQPAWKDPR